MKERYQFLPKMTFTYKEGTPVPEVIRGDVNNDTQVNIGDVTALINYLLSKNPAGINLDAADCNKDTQLNISDVTALISYLLSKSWNN